MAASIPPKQSSDSPRSAQTVSPTVFRTGRLTDTLEKLRQTLDNLAGGSSSSLGGLGSFGGLGSGAGFSSSTQTASAARLSLAPVQTLVNQIQRTMTSTSQAFTASMEQARKAWQRNTASFATDFFGAMHGQSRKRRGWGARSGRATRRAWQASMAWTRRQARSMQQRSRHWAKRYHKMMGRRHSGISGSTASARRRGSAWAQATRRFSQAWSRTARRVRRPTSNWARRSRQAAQTWRRTGKRFRRSAAAWTRLARRGFRQSSLWARQARVRLGKNLTRWGRRTARRSRVAWRRAGRTFARTRSPGAALRSGLGSFVGRGGLMAGMGQFGIVLNSLTAAVGSLRHQAEATNARNRHLGGYNGQIGMAFHQLALGDLQRNIALGRDTQGSAVTLANLTNKARDTQASFDRLTAGVSNRVASAQSVLWDNLTAPWALAADALGSQLNWIDPNGTGLARLTNTPYATTAGIGGFLGAIWGGSSIKDALNQADQAFQAQQARAFAGKPLAMDPFSTFIGEAKNLGPIRAARQVTL